MRTAEIGALSCPRGRPEGEATTGFRCNGAGRPRTTREREYLRGQAPVIIAAWHRLRRESAPGAAPCSTVPS